jgi:protein O-GlcNAc transferase
MRPSPLKNIYLSRAGALARKASHELAQREQQCLTALAENGRDPNRYIDLADCFVQMSRQEEAVETLRLGLANCPATPRIHRRYIGLLAQCNRTQEAIQIAAAAKRLFPGDLGFRLNEHLLLPIIYQSSKEIDYYRDRFSVGLERLLRDLDLSTPETRQEALYAIARHHVFRLAYQGRDVLPLQQQYGVLVDRIMAANYPQWAQRLSMPQVSADGALRIGFASAHFRLHSVSKDHVGWLREHDPKQVHVFAYSMGKQTDYVTDQVKRIAKRFWRHSGSFEETCGTIISDRLHVLVHLDIGMDPISAQLGALRLAPVQCVTWGHPITSGLPSMDYFLSSDLMETDDSARFYSEQLVRLPGIGICYEKPIIPTVLFNRRRSDLGIREDAIVYLSCQSASKYLPEHDHIFPDIACRVPQAQFVFLASNSSVREDFYKRLNRAFGVFGMKAEDKCIWLPPQNSIDYWNLNSISDVYLDTIDWSGCNTTMEAIACKLPVVTLPAGFMRGRHSAAMLTQLGVTETIANDKADYVSIAVRLGVEPEWRRSVVARMVAGYPRLYSDTRSVTSLESFYQKVVEARLDRLRE